jgi:lysylphosphatidylglycerol synthetase-like protein (DUF2156 family)
MQKITANHSIRELCKKLPDVSGHFKKLAVLNDQKKAGIMAREYLEANFTIAFGEEQDELHLDIMESNECVKQIKKLLEAQRQLVNSTNRMIRVQDKLECDIPDKSLRNMRKILDIVLGIFCIMLALIMLGMGASNIFAIIMASGTPVFLEEPRLAWMLSGLLPIGAFSLEFFKHHLPSDKAKTRCTLLIYALTAILLLTWIVMFAFAYGNPSSDIDLNTLLESSAHDLGQSFTMVQLLAELFVGASLFMTSGELFAKYSPTKLVANPDYERAVILLSQIQRDYEAKNCILNQKKARLRNIDATLKLYLGEEMVKFERLSARFSD